MATITFEVSEIMERAFASEQIRRDKTAAEIARPYIIDVCNAAGVDLSAPIEEQTAQVEIAESRAARIKADRDAKAAASAAQIPVPETTTTETATA